ncbi:hypothetical protein CYMTET_49360 [Cymbomonas tetramitiformis]|uniref:Uncharacterized protein n=1 Tax=Cymbomonas tetramitiformis TaxID=36881 RepID=A0AAE0BS14_9CHLO|nr:hypothetical protein CYMTET_49360 [Cymbomonas tetramitiformis]
MSAEPSVKFSSSTPSSSEPSESCVIEKDDPHLIIRSLKALLMFLDEWPSSYPLIIFLTATWVLAKWMSWSLLLLAIICVIQTLQKKKHRLFLLLDSRHYSAQLSEIASFEDCESEQAIWLNRLLERFWPDLISPMVSKIIQNNVQYYLDYYRPGALTQLELIECTLGKKAPIVKGAKAYCLSVDTPSDVELEWDLDITTGEDMRLALKALVGSKYMGVPVNVFGENLVIRGKLRFRVGSIDFKKSPVVGLMRISFNGQPELDFTVRSVGKIEILDLPGVSEVVDSALGNIISDLMVKPKAIEVNLDEIWSRPPEPEKRPVRVDVKVIKAENLVAADKPVIAEVTGDEGTSDPYVDLQILEKKRKTKVIKKTLNPTWNADYVFLLSDEEWERSPLLTFKVKDWDLVGRHTSLGDAIVVLEELEDGVPKIIWLYLENIAHGRLMVSITIHGNVEQKTEATAELKRVGTMSQDISGTEVVVTVEVISAENLVAADPAIPFISKASSDPYVSLQIGTQRERTTIIQKQLNPVWNQKFQFVIQDNEWRHPSGMHRMLKLIVKDWDIASDDDILGNAIIDLLELEKECSEPSIMWVNLKDAPHGRLQLKVHIAEVTSDHTAEDESLEPPEAEALSEGAVKSSDEITEVTRDEQRNVLDRNISSRAPDGPSLNRLQSTHRYSLKKRNIAADHLHGYLTKRHGFFKSIKTFYFVIKATELVFFEDESMSSTKGSIPLNISSCVSATPGTQIGLGRYPLSVKTRQETLIVRIFLQAPLPNPPLPTPLPVPFPVFTGWGALTGFPTSDFFFTLESPAQQTGHFQHTAQYIQSMSNLQMHP